MADSVVTVRITQRQGYQFDNEYGGTVPKLLTDEPPPLGQGAGPEPAQLLASAVGNCLAASLIFSLAKYRQRADGLACQVDAEIGRNADKRLRVLGLRVRLTLPVAAAELQHLDRALASFEDFCTVTGSIRAAIPVSVEVVDAAGAVLK